MTHEFLITTVIDVPDSEAAESFAAGLRAVPVVRSVEITPIISTEAPGILPSLDTGIETEVDNGYSLKELSQVVSLARYDELRDGPTGMPKEKRYGDYSIYSLLGRAVGRARNADSDLFKIKREKGKENHYDNDQVRAILSGLRLALAAPENQTLFNYVGITEEVIERAEELISTTAKPKLMESYLKLVEAAATAREQLLKTLLTQSASEPPASPRS